MDISLGAQGALSPVNLFLQADWVIKLVMIGLLLASVWSWHIIHSTWRSLKRVYDNLALDDPTTPQGRILAAANEEMKRGAADPATDIEGRRQRLATRLNNVVTGESDKLGARLNVLATIGSVSPFVGLFGTVWGIMRAFSGIAASQNTSLAVVAPGIAEALFATAIGLFAAIPAVIAYNRLGHLLDRVETNLGHYADELHAQFSRDMVKGE